METHNHDEHHVYDGVETQERSEMEDHSNTDKLMASSASRKNILSSLETLNPYKFGSYLAAALSGREDFHYIVRLLQLIPAQPMI